MLGARSAGELSGRWWCSWGARGIASWAGRGSAVEDWLAALNAGCSCGLIAGTWHRNRCSDDGCLVYRAGACLRHNHAPGGQGRGGRGAMRMTLRARSRRWRRIGRSRSFWFENEGWRTFLRCGGGRLNRRLNGGWSGYSCSYRGRSRCCCDWRWRGNRSRLIDRGGNGCLWRGGNWRCGLRLCGNCGLLCRANLFVAGRRSHVRLNHHGLGWRHNHDRPSHGNSACRCLGYYWTGWGTGSNRRWSRRCDDNRRRRARLRNNLPRFRPGGLLRRRCNGDRRRGSNRRRRRSGRTHGGMRLPRFLLLFLLIGQNGLHHISWLGNVREIYFWSDGLRSTGGRRTRMTARSAVQMHAYLLRLVVLQGTRVRFSVGQAEFRQYVKNLPALDFHLACEIVDTNLTHPPLFKICYPSPLVAHSYLMALAGFLNPVE